MDFSTENIIKSALAEDIAYGDITSEICVSADKRANGYFTAKENGIICGTEILCDAFHIIDNEIDISLNVKDGDKVEKGDVIAEISGSARHILTGERTALNFIQHLSGIATKTFYAVQSVKGFGARITDTRKTTPGLRTLEKYAVRMGGGINHRFGLSDGILIKDNHIAAAGSITSAVKAARRSAPHTLKIEVETSDIGEVEEALEAGADIIMLDNMTIQQIKEAVEKIGGRAMTEASGNMGEKDIRTVAATGVDIISIGALTHSAPALDISLKFNVNGI